MKLRRPLWRPMSLAAALVLLPVAAVPLAAEEPQVQIRVARLIEKLGSDSYPERSEANEELAGLGPAARQQLEEATNSPDPEVRLRAKDLLRRLNVLDLWSAGRVDYQARHTPASTALAALAAQTGNRLLVGDQYGVFHDRQIDLDHAGSSFWEVVDDLCRQSGNRVRPHYDTRKAGLVVVSGELGRNPVAYSGPLRTQVAAARRVFTEELDYADLASERTHTFQLDLQMMWEDRFKLVAYRSQPELVEAVTDSGVQLAATQPSPSGWNVAGSGTRQLAMSLRLHPPATSASELETLRLKWGLIAVGDLASIEIENLESKQPHFRDDVELVLESFQQGPGPRCEVTLVITRDLVVPEPQEVLFQENDVELVDAEGRAFRKQGQTNSLTDQGAKMKLTFAAESASSTPKLLRFVYPRIRAQKEVDIVFHHVPLPVGRPD